MLILPVMVLFLQILLLLVLAHMGFEVPERKAWQVARSCMLSTTLGRYNTFFGVFQYILANKVTRKPTHILHNCGR